MHPTPSTTASPVPHRVSSLVRHTDGPSPSKRRKIGTGSPASDVASLSGHSMSTADIQRGVERRAPSTRLRNWWSTLESKYTLPLDDDDIIDFWTYEMTKDRGVVSGQADKPIGCFADAQEVEGERAGPAGDDEIGGWGSGSELGHGFIPNHVPPVRELDPEDAEDAADLRAFLAAEESRKAQQGVEEDLGEDEPPDGEGPLEGPYGATDGSVIEVEAESALAISEAESDDELDGYDETVGDGALLWEVGTHLDNSSEPFGIESDYAAPKVVPTLALRNMTPTQLRTPPLSRSSARSPHIASFPFRRPPVNLSPSSAARHQSNLTTSGMTNKKGEQKGTRSSERPIDALQYKGLKRDCSVRPTQKLLAEVFVPSPPCGGNIIRQDMPADEDELLSPPRSRGRTSIRPDNKASTKQTPNHGPSMSSTSKPHRRHSMPSVPSGAQVVDIDDQTADVSEPVGRSEAQAPASPRNAKWKRGLSRDADMGDDRISSTRMSDDSSEDDNVTLPETLAAPTRCRRCTRRRTTSNPADIPRSSSRHASVVPPASLDFWHPYQHGVSTAPPYSMPYPPHLSYMGFGRPPSPAPACSHPNPHVHQPPVPAPQMSSHHPSMPTSPWPYPIPYFHPSASQPHPHPHGSAWFYPQYPYPYSQVAHLQHSLHASAPSSPFPPFTPRSGDDPPPSPREPLSSPTPAPKSNKKGKGKKVSFSDEDADETANAQPRASGRGKGTVKRLGIAPTPRARRNSQGSNTTIDAPGPGSGYVSSVSDSSPSLRRAQSEAVQRRVRKNKKR